MNKIEKMTESAKNSNAGLVKKTMTIKFMAECVKMREAGSFVVAGNVDKESSERMTNYIKNELNVFEILSLCSGYRDEKPNYTNLTENRDKRTTGFGYLEYIIRQCVGMDLDNGYVICEGFYDTWNGCYILRFFYYDGKDND